MVHAKRNMVKKSTSRKVFYKQVNVVESFVSLLNKMSLIKLYQAVININFEPEESQQCFKPHRASDLNPTLKSSLAGETPSILFCF